MTPLDNPYLWNAGRWTILGEALQEENRFYEAFSGRRWGGGILAAPSARIRSQQRKPVDSA
jgi:hypothetical protein